MRTPPATQRAIVTFCWLPPESRRTSPCARVSICSVSIPPATFFRSSLVLIESPPAQARGEGQGDVLADGALHQQGLGAVRRDVDESRPDRVGGVVERHGRAIDQELAPARPLGAGQDVEQLVLALALEGDDAEDLARVQVERHVVELRPGAEATSGEARFRARVARTRGRPACNRRHLPDGLAEHELDDPLLGAVGDVHDTDRLALAQHGGPVADGGNLDHPVGNEDHGAVAASPACDDFEDALGEVRR